MKTAQKFGEHMLPTGITWYSEFETMMIEFAKAHVEAALKAALNNGNLYLNPDNNEWEIETDSILNAYPLTNIV